MRLQQAIVASGLASRRKAEQLVRDGAVTVGGRVVRDPVCEVDPLRDDVRVSGKRAVPEEKVSIVLHKPRGVMTTMDDPEGRTTVADLVRGLGVRVVPVGRLDYDTQGVLLLTNDGDLAYPLLHPSSGVERVYHAKMKGRVTPRALDLLRRGVTLEDGRARVDRVRILGSTGKHTWAEIVVHEGRNHLIRRLGYRVGHPIQRLHRVSIAGITAAGLAPGQWRHLTKREMEALRRLAGLRGSEKRPAPASQRPRRAGRRSTPRSRGDS